MEVASFDEIAEEFQKRVARIAWCSVSTVDRQGRPRQRILHPIWEGTTGWIATGPQSHKAKHLAGNPYVSLSYWDPQHQQVYVDAKAEWVEDAATKKRIWERPARRVGRRRRRRQRRRPARVRPGDHLEWGRRGSGVRAAEADAVAHRAVRAGRPSDDAAAEGVAGEVVDSGHWLVDRSDGEAGAVHRAEPEDHGCGAGADG